MSVRTSVGFQSQPTGTDGPNVDKINARELHDQLLAAKPEGARHDADICSFCVDKAATQTAPVPSGSGSSNRTPESTEGGTTTAMSNDTETKTMTVETHEALLEKALREGTEALNTALAAKAAEVDRLTAEVASLTETKTTQESEIARLNGELDAAQLEVKSAKDEVASLKQEKADAELAAQRTELASKRAEQVRNLGLFEETFITERASKWAELPDSDWAERVDEWSSARKPGSQGGDTASAMSGTSGELTKEHVDTAKQESSPRRAVLGLLG